MKKQLIEVVLPRVFHRLQRQSDQGRHVIHQPLGGGEAQRIPARIAQFGQADRIHVERQQGLIVLGTFAAVLVISEVIRLRHIEDQSCLLLPIHRRNTAVQNLLIGSSVVFQPTGYMFPLRVVVRPVDLTSLFVPDVLAIEAYAIARLQPLDPLRQVDVVHNKNSLT